MANQSSTFLNVMFGGEAGQGLQTLGLILARTLRGWRAPCFCHQRVYVPHSWWQQFANLNNLYRSCPCPLRPN